MLFEVEECLREDAQKYVDIIEQYCLTYEFLEVFLMLDREALEGLVDVGHIKPMPKEFWYTNDEPVFCIDDIETYLYSDDLLVAGVMFRVEDDGGRDQWASKLQKILDKIVAIADKANTPERRNKLLEYATKGQ